MVYPSLWRRGTPTLIDEVLASVASAWIPAVDVRETADAIRVRAELPGLTRENLTVNLQNNVLSISGEKKSETTGQDEGEWHLVERRYGRFERSFTLPRTVNPQEIAAQFRDGILTITLPKAEAAKPRRIEIAVNG